MNFADAALRLAGLAAAMLGWRPSEFWSATPAELAASLAPYAPAHSAPPSHDDLARLREQFPDG